MRAHLELCQCQSTQGQGQLSAKFHGPELAAVFFGRGLASSLEVSPLSVFSKDPSLQAESSDLDSNLTHAKYLVVIPAVIKGSAVMSNADLVSYKIPKARANESGFAMPPKERSDGAG